MCSPYTRTHLHGVGEHIPAPGSDDQVFLTVENTFYREHILHTFMALGSISLLKAATTKSVCCSNIYEGRRFFIWSSSMITQSPKPKPTHGISCLEPYRDSSLCVCERESVCVCVTNKLTRHHTFDTITRTRAHTHSLTHTCRSVRHRRWRGALQSDRSTQRRCRCSRLDRVQRTHQTANSPRTRRPWPVQRGP